jgi:hypothetical protein
LASPDPSNAIAKNGHPFDILAISVKLRVKLRVRLRVKLGAKLGAKSRAWAQPASASPDPSNAVAKNAEVFETLAISGKTESKTEGKTESETGSEAEGKTEGKAGSKIPSLGPASLSAASPSQPRSLKCGRKKCRALRDSCHFRRNWR